MAERGFSSARRSYQSKLLALFELEAYVVKNLLACCVGIGYVFELYFALHVLKRLCGLSFGLWLLLHYFNEALKSAETVLILLHKVDQRINGTYEKIYRYYERGVISRGYLSKREENSARDENYYVENVGDKGGRGKEFCHSLIGSARGVNEFLVALVEFFDLARGICIRLGYSDTRNTAFDRGVYRRVALSSVVKRAVHRFSEMHSYYNEYRHAGKNYKRQHPVYSHKVGKGQNYHYRAYKQILGSVVRKLADLKEVACYSCHNASRFVIVVKAIGKLLKMRKEVLSHLRLHLYAYYVTVILHEIA